MARLTAEQMMALAGSAPVTGGTSVPSGSPPPGYQPYQPGTDTGSKSLLGQEDPTAAAIRLTKEKLAKPKHPVLSFLANAATGHTQKFAQTLGSAASVFTGDVEKQNASKMAEEESRLQLAKLLETASPEQVARIKSQLSQESNTKIATELDPTLNKTWKQVAGEGLGTAMEALSGGSYSGGGFAAGGGVLTKAVPEIAAKSIGGAIGRGALKGATMGALGGVATGAEENKSAGGILASGGIGGVTGGVVGGVLGGATYKLGQVMQDRAAEKASKLVGKATKETGENLKKAVKAVGTLGPDDLKMIDNDYGKMAEVVDTRVQKLIGAVDDTMLKVPDPKPLSTFDKIYTYGTKGGTTAENPVETSLQMLDDLYTAKGDAKALAAIRTLQESAQTDGVTAKQVNDLARQFGGEYSGFNPKTGNPLTSHKAETFEEVRKALKESARALLPDDDARNLDSEMSNLILLRESAKEMTENVQKVENVINEPGFLKKVGSTIGKSVNFLTGGALKSFMASIMPASSAVDRMDAIAAQAQLSKNLTLANKLLTMGENERVKFIAKLARDFISRSAPTVTRNVGEGTADLLTGN